MSDYLEYYYADNGKRLKKMIDRIIVNFGGIFDKDKDDFYSIGNEVFVSALNSYKDGDQSFGSYLKLCITNKIKTEISKRNAIKISADVDSLDSEEEPIDIVDEKDFEEEILSKESAKKMLSCLSKTGQKIISLRLQNKTDADIRSELGLTDRQFENEIKKAQARFKNVAPVKDNVTVKRNADNKEGREEKVMNIAPDYRDDHLSLDLLK